MLETLLKGAALVVGLVGIAVGVVGVICPDIVSSARRLYFATPYALYTAATARFAMGFVVLLFSPYSRVPKVLVCLGALMCLQALAATVMGPERARVVLEWEVAHTVLLRAGAVVAVMAGGVLVFATTTGARDRHKPTPR